MYQETSALAYKTVNLTRRERQVLEMFQAHPNEELTNQELADLMDWPINRITGRTQSLRDKKVIRFSKPRACTSPNGFHNECNTNIYIPPLHTQTELF